MQTSSGAGELRKVKLADAIVYVHPEGERIVPDVYKLWLRAAWGWLVQTACLSQLAYPVVVF